MNYYSRLISAIRATGDSRFPDDLASYHEASVTQANDIAKAAISSTRRFAERVG